MAKQDLSLGILIISKNAAKTIKKTLESIKDIADEIVVVDSGSLDNTQEIVEKYKAKFIKNTNWQGFGKQRQFAQKKLSSDLVLAIDTDEILDIKLQNEIKKIKQTTDGNTIYKIKRITSIFGKFIKYSSWQNQYIFRLYPRKITQYNDFIVHEKLLIPKKAKTKKLQGKILHFTATDLMDYVKKQIIYIESSAKKKHEQTKFPLLKLIFGPGFTFFKMYILRFGFLDGVHGIIIASISCYYNFLVYTKIYLDKWQKKKQ